MGNMYIFGFSKYLSHKFGLINTKSVEEAESSKKKHKWFVLIS